jgi:hypothetical protein
VWRGYEDFVKELTSKFPHEAAGIRSFYDDCWKVFNALNSLGGWFGGTAGGGGGVVQGAAGRGGAPQQQWVGRRPLRAPPRAASISHGATACRRCCALETPELKSLEEPRYLMGEFFKDPVSCLTLASFLITNTGGWMSG